MPAAEMQQVNNAVTEVERVPFANQHRGWCDDHSTPLLNRLLALSYRLREQRPFVRFEMSRDPNMAVNWCIYL